jgi:hypothetical protein
VKIVHMLNIIIAQAVLGAGILMNTTKTLWSDSARIRHFLVPDSETLPSGDFILRTLTGRQQEVDPEALAPFEVTREQAKAWLKDQFGQVLQTAKGAVMDALGRGLAAAPDVEPPPSEQSASAKASPMTPGQSPGLSLLSALSGEPIDSLRTDAESVGRGVQKIVAELGAIFEDATAPEDAGLENARQRISLLRTILQEHGLPVSAKAEDIPDRLREMVRSAEHRQDFEEAAAGLEVLARGVEQAAAMTAKHLRALAQRLRERRAESD